MTKCHAPLVIGLCLVLLSPSGAAGQAPPPAPDRARTHDGDLGLHGLSFQQAEFEDGRLDFHRFVLLVTHRFSDRIRFVSELELEHALVEGLEEGGELELEQAYVDFLLSRRFNVRAGMMLVPVGIINERHEPPDLLRRRAALRRYGDRADHLVRGRALACTVSWAAAGAYRAYVMSPLNATEFTAEEGLARRNVRRDPIPTSGVRPSRAGWNTSAFAGLTAGRELLDRPVRFRIPAAIRRAGEAR